jgi:hypothetical protein
MLRLDDVVDVLFGEDECLVLTSTTCLRLSSVPAALVALLDRPRPETEVRAALNDRFGDAPEGRLEEVLGELVEHRVVQRR